MSQLNPSSFYRLKQIIGDRNSKPPMPPIFPVSPSTWWRGVKEGRFPQPQKLSPKVTVWKGADLIALAEEVGNAS